MALPNFDVLAHVEDQGDLHGGPGEYVGTRGKGKSMEGYSVTFTPRVDGIGLRYRAHVRGSGDTPWAKDGEFVGSRRERKPVEGFSIELSGPKLAEYDVQYMTHVEREGDTGWASNGEFCGTRGRTLATQGLAVRILPRAPQYVQIISKASSGSGKPLVITASAKADDFGVRVSAPNGSDLQTWDRRPVKGGQGYALINKGRPTLCLARGNGQPTVLKPVTQIDTDDRCVWRNDNVPGPFNAINNWSDWEQKLNMSGNPPYADRDNLLITYPWAHGANNELWRQLESSYDVVAGTDGTALNALSEAIYRGCYPTVFSGSLTIGQLGIQSVGYNITDPPRIEVQRSALFEEHARERFAKLLGSSAEQAVPLSAAAAASTLTVSIARLQLIVIAQAQTTVEASLTIAANVQANPDRSITLELTSGRLSIPDHPALQDALNQVFVPVLLAYLNATVLKQISIPPIELLGVQFTAPLLATQHPHLIAATTQIPGVAALPPAPTQWPTGKVFAAIDERALNAVASAAIGPLGPHDTWDYSIDIGVCDLSLNAAYNVSIGNARFTVKPSSGNVYKVQIDLGGRGSFGVKCGLSGTLGAWAGGSVTATAAVSIDHRNHVMVTFQSLDELSLSWHFDDVPFWLPGIAITAILKAFEPVARAAVTKALRGKTFDVYSIPKIDAAIAGKTFEITLRDLALGSTEDGVHKPLLLGTGLASVRVK